MPKSELVIQLVKIAIALMASIYFVWWSQQMLRAVRAKPPARSDDALFNPITATEQAQIVDPVTFEERFENAKTVDDLLNG